MRVLLSLSKFFMHRLLIVIGQMNLDYLLFSLACSQVTQLNIYVGMFQPQEGFQVTQPGQTQLYMFRGGKESKNSWWEILQIRNKEHLETLNFIFFVFPIELGLKKYFLKLDEFKILKDLI